MDTRNFMKQIHSAILYKRIKQHELKIIWATIQELYAKRIESIKTTSMEDVSTRVLEKIKNI